MENKHISNCGAIISDCKKYRYQLWRIWDSSKPFVLFIMHNPSTADGTDDDPTIRRCINFAKSWGYGGIYVGNLFPYRATDPKELIGLTPLVLTPFNNIMHIGNMIIKCKLHVLAYGNPIIKAATPIISDERWHCLKVTKFGNPCHPLYLKHTLQPIPFTSIPFNLIIKNDESKKEDQTSKA